MFDPLFASLIVVTLAVAETAPAPTPSPEELASQLTGARAASAVESVLTASDTQPPYILFLAAHAALTNGQREDAAFLFYAAQLRTHFERACFPPVETGGDDPYVFYGALSQQVGQAINPASMAAPKEFAAALARLKAWTPRAGDDYDPGYKHADRLTEAEATAAVAERRTAYLAQMEDLSKLLSLPEYGAAFRTLQSANFGEPTDASAAAAAEAEATMRRIEQETKLKGVFSQ